VKGRGSDLEAGRGVGAAVAGVRLTPWCSIVVMVSRL
jgi:hypothetical protein